MKIRGFFIIAMKIRDKHRMREEDKEWKVVKKDE